MSGPKLLSSVSGAYAANGISTRSDELGRPIGRPAGAAVKLG